MVENSIKQSYIIGLWLQPVPPKNTLASNHPKYAQISPKCFKPTSNLNNPHQVDTHQTTSHPETHHLGIKVHSLGPNMHPGPGSDNRTADLWSIFGNKPSHLWVVTCNHSIWIHIHYPYICIYVLYIYIYTHTISSHILNTSTKPTSAIHHELSCSST